ncbi:MAG: SDR family NAD(P)-dependent oxidoreductase, partial [Bacteroidota bacterium]
IQVNFLGPVALIKALHSKLSEGKAHVVNISTMGAYQGSVKFPELTAYAASKAALTNFTEVFAEEQKATGIRMNCLCLGAVNTEMLNEAFPGYQAPTSAEEMAKYIAEFTLNSGNLFNGKIIPVSSSTP